MARLQAAESRVRVRGIVTVEPGRIVDDRTFVIQDPTGGILVRLDGGRKDLVFARGTDIIVEGRLTSRYGTLEVRLDGDDPLEVLGSGVLPSARTVQLADLGESTEALLVHASGTVSDIDRAPSGTTTLILEDATGRGRIVAFAAAGPMPDGIERGVTLAVDGIAGQRASAKGRLDGYRIWVRDGGDLQVLAPAPTASPSGTADPSASPAVVTIAVARTRVGTTAAVEGTVTSQGGLLDADGRRVTIQDGTAGILIRLAARETAPAVGSRVRVVGSVGTYYGAPQLSASAPAERLGSATVSPVRLAKAPGAGVEWQLVRLKGTVVDVKRTGQSWRAELALTGGARVPIVGLTRAGIRVDRIREGQQGTIVGIVRRAYPSAKDGRFALLPRGRADLHLATATSTAHQAAGAPRSSTSGGAVSAVDGSPSTSASASGADADAPPLMVEATELPANLGRLVRIGGLVVSVAAPEAAEGRPAVVIDDASGLATLRLPVTAIATVYALVPGDLIEAIGVVQAIGDDRVEVLVGDPADVLVAGQVTGAQNGRAPGASSVSPAASESPGQGVPSAGLDRADPSAPDGASVPPLMGAAGAGVFLAAILATGAAGARWRRRTTRQQASKEATERLVELLSATHEPPPGV